MLGFSTEFYTKEIVTHLETNFYGMNTIQTMETKEEWKTIEQRKQ
jgi:hypothetical protein